MDAVSRAVEELNSNSFLLDMFMGDGLTPQGEVWSQAKRSALQ